MTEFSNLFDSLGFSLGIALGIAWDDQHTIDTRNAQLLRQQLYQAFLTERKPIDKEVDTILAKHIIQPSTSPWSSVRTIAT